MDVCKSILTLFTIVSDVTQLISFLLQPPFVRLTNDRSCPWFHKRKIHLDWNLHKNLMVNVLFAIWQWVTGTDWWSEYDKLIAMRDGNYKHTDSTLLQVSFIVKLFRTIVLDLLALMPFHWYSWGQFLKRHDQPHCLRIPPTLDDQSNWVDLISSRGRSIHKDHFERKFENLGISIKYF